MGRLVHAVEEALWPTRCFGCDRPGALLCPACTAALPAIDQRLACPRCGAPFGALVCTECTRCLERSDDRDAQGAPPVDGLPHLDGVRCYGVHAWPLDHVVRGHKDGGEYRAASLLAAMLAQATQGFAEDVQWDGVAFVPCTHAAFARRGRDHMEGVARELGGLLDLPVVDCLARQAPRDQRGLSRSQRALNAAESLVSVVSLQDRRLLLVDDVLTTGATLSAAAGVLRQAGAVGVEGACVARAW